jgi:hypothetical protein
VSHDGAATLEESTDPPGAYKLSVAMIVVGGALFAATVIGAILRGDEAGSFFGLAVVSFIVAFVGAIRSNRFGLTWYLRQTFGSDSNWQPLFGPTKWAPRSVDQLRAVELLADEHDGKAFARPHPDGGTEARTLKHGRLHTHVVAPEGTVLLVNRSKPATLYVLGVAAIVIGIGGAVVTTLLYNLTDLHVVTAFYVSGGLFFVGTVLRSWVTLESRVKDQAAGAWHLVQTKPDDTD